VKNTLERSNLSRSSTRGGGFRPELIHEHPRRKLAEVIQGIIDDLAPYAVNVASPYFIGHMTDAQIVHEILEEQAAI
jgi:hypothetical protein